MNTTSDRDAFIRAIIAEPDEDAPRLVFADWLDEHGEPERAEFIRVQVALAQLSEGEPDSDRRSREHALLKRHSAKWLAELPAMTGVKPTGFQRGFIQQVAFANLKAFRLHAATVSRYPVHAVTFGTLTPGTTRSLARMAELSHVRSLSLHRSGADAASLADLFRSPHLAGLRRLELYGSPIESEVMEAIGQHLGNLEVLIIGTSGLSDECLVAFARAATLLHLRELGLSNNHLADAAAVALADARGLPALRRLSLSSNRVSDVGIVALARSPHLPALRHLRLWYNPFGGEGLAALVARTSLESVEVNGDSLETSSPALGRSFTAIGPPADRRLLDVWRGGLNDEGLAALVRCPGFETITTLQPFNSPLSEVGLQALANVPEPIALREFKLYSLVKASGVEAFLLSPRLAHLKLLVLRLSGPGDTEPANEPPVGSVWSATVTLSIFGNDESVAWLARSASLRRVRELSISGSELPFLIPSPHLTGLEGLSVLSAKLAQVRVLVSATHLRLKRLALRAGKQGDARARMLAAIPHLASLEELEMFDDKVGDHGALALATSPHLGGLRKLDLRRNAISADAIRRLRERFGERVLLSEPEGTS